ncbi:hypothetical protein [Amycolatopsis sp. NBC_01480]|uniref:hypothetical protein n=1 Tax=Amycolatopsis sp. NBC_01480 TaxID=2903562 RepID=UPI002E27C52B|nr:hypothetical protein [Amycolatopsis sp. NBC_01480]
MTATPIEGQVLVDQHSSHQKLVDQVDAARVTPRNLDAIIVPTSRRPGGLANAIEAARATKATLIVLCSKDASVAETMVAVKESGVRGYGVDLGLLDRERLLPRFETETLLADLGFARGTDTSLKRNLGLMIASLAGWKRVLFLDDDIAFPAPKDLGAAAGLLGKYAAVGLTNSGMPDNSVVCHALRSSGREQDTFVGGGALAVERRAFGSFFPDIYNEDWFFLLDDQRLLRTAVTGTAHQEPYDPYHSPQRAESEELGDTLAEGLFGLLDDRRAPGNATLDYWTTFLDSRRRLIRELLDETPDWGDTQHMHLSLKAALSQSERIEPEFCVEYLERWREDRSAWSSYLEMLTVLHGENNSMEDVFGALSLSNAVQSAR